MAQPGLPLRAAGRPDGVTAGPIWASGGAEWRRDPIPRLAAAMAAAAGLLNLVSALLPAERVRLRLLDDLVPGAVSRGATIATAAAGVGLLLLAGGLRRRQRLAWLAGWSALGLGLGRMFTPQARQPGKNAAVNGVLAAMFASGVVLTFQAYRPAADRPQR